MGHSCRTLLWVTLLGSSCGTLLIPPIIPLTSDAPRLHQHVSRSPVARRQANTLPTKAAQIRMALRHHERSFATRSTTHKKQTYHTIPQIIPLTSDTPRLRKHVSPFPVARRHANTLPTKAAWHCDITNVISPYGPPHTSSKHITRYRQSSCSPATRRVYASMFRASQWRGSTLRMTLRHHERNFTTRFAHTQAANISHDTAHHPAHQRHTAFTPACFALPSGTASRKRTSHQGRANPHGTATSRT